MLVKIPSSCLENGKNFGGLFVELIYCIISAIDGCILVNILSYLCHPLYNENSVHISCKNTYCCVQTVAGDFALCNFVLISRNHVV